MEKVSIIAVLGFIIFLLFLFFAGFLLTVKTKKKIGNALLASFLIVVAIDISVFFYTIFGQFDINLEMLRVKLSNLKDPLLFLYILSVIYADFRLKKIHALHGLHWLVSLLILIPSFFLASYADKEVFVTNYDTTFEGSFLNILGILMSLGYFIAMVYYVFRYRKLLKENYTDEDSFKNYKWLKQFIVLITIGQILTLIKGYIRDAGFSEDLTATFRIIVLLFGVFFIFWLFLKALHSPKLFRGVQVGLATSKEIENKVNPTEDRIEDLKKYMTDEEPFLNPSLTIRNLADQMQMPMRDLSVLINQKLDKHFFDFVNQYRIEKAKKLLSNTSKQKLTVLEILYEVGFNSKSSFNTAFKKHTGKTPTQYRKSVA